ncbi:MAG: family 20 glycosylhydrolase [Dysgonamonadaceae bacterium]|jgi:hexosaminidase|nr:family 20 glycosylhydrolase [Dysgonamonadaceae bacterium]
MNKLLSAVIVCLFLFFASFCTEPGTKPYNEGINIVPMPLELEQKEGNFMLSKQTVFVVNNEAAEKIASFFSEKISRSTSFKLKSVHEKPASNYISLEIKSNLPINEEGYLLEASAEGINIQSNTPTGLFYGMQTVMQLLPAEIESKKVVKGMAWTVPAVKIKDEPRFSYRGMHLDACRHFASIDFIKKQLDLLSLFKINKFHWHLTDDQGWRIEIKKYPKLTEIGAQRTEGEGNTYGPFFYTHEEIKEIVAYAKERFIEVIPEIEFPGHAVAAISAYPELSCTGKTIQVRNIWGVANDVFCAGKESTFEFMENVLTEVIPLFESDYFHIGGDECPKGRWKECPDCQARIRSLGIKANKEHSAEEQLQSYFISRVEKVLLAHNKKMIGWNEILEGGLAPSATVMSWQGETGGIAAANMGHDVIMTPGEWMYLDKYQGDSKVLPVTIGGYLNLEKVYNYDPVPKKIDDDKTRHILGAQTNVWTEYKYTENDMEHDIYPRVIALAELNWTPKYKKDYKDFERRIENQRARLDKYDVNYYIPRPEQKGAPSCDFVAFTDSAVIELETSEPVKIVYTTDGRDPSANSKEYTEALTFSENTSLKVRSIVLSGRMSPIRTITLEKQSLAPAVEKEKNIPKGIKAEYYQGLCRTLAELDNKTPDEEEYIDAPQQSKHQIKGYGDIYHDDVFWSTILSGYIHIPEDGVYYFSTDYEFWIDNELLVSNKKDNRGTAHRFSRSDKSIALSKGYHTFKLARLGTIFGGWPTQWNRITLAMRKADKPDFKIMGADFFE